MAEDYILLTDGEKLRAITLTVGANSVKAQVGVLSDATTGALIGGDATNGLNVHVTNATIAVTASSLPLPTGASTSALQSTGNTSLASIDGKITAVNTGAVVVASSALPTGASTEATLALIKAKTDNIDVALSTRTKPADAQHAIIDSGTVTATVSGTVTVDSELTTADLDTGAGTDTRAVMGLVLAESGGGLLVGSAHPLPISGTVGVSGSVAVTGTFWQATQPVSGTFWQATQPVSGTVTANAGTNLNTSALALEAGNLATVAAAVRAEDAASADAHTGIGALAIRKGTPGNTSGTDGDYEFLQMSAGRLWASATIDAALPAGTNVIGHVIADTGSTTVVTGNVTVVQATASNLNAQVVGAAASGAAKSGNPVQIGGVFNTTQPTVTSGQAVEGQATARGAAIVATGVDTFNVTVNTALPAGSNAIGKLAANDTVDIGDVTINNASGASAVNIQDGGNSITVDGTVAATQSGTWNIGTLTTLTGITNVVHVDDNAGSITVDNAGTFAVQAAQSGTYTVAQGTAAAASGAWPVYDTVSGVAVDPRSSQLQMRNAAGTFMDVGARLDANSYEALPVTEQRNRQMENSQSELLMALREDVADLTQYLAAIFN